ncbi:MAG: transcriptional repressor [Candidatus Andersenbacteria bacterium]
MPHTTTQSDQALAGLLRSAGCKATPRRIGLLRILAADQTALSIAELQQKLKSLRQSVNQTTIYRALEDLMRAGLVRPVNFEHQHAHYELIAQKPHHHHVICKSCGLVEDVEACNARPLEKQILKHSKNFSSISTHALEFFATCTSCANLA